jgi:hypothetical protein
MRTASLVAAVIIAGTMSAPGQKRDFAAGQDSAPKATTDPLMRIYDVPGVFDNGAGSNAGIATVFHCTNFGNETELVRIVVRNFDGSAVGSLTQAVGSQQTETLTTHFVSAFIEFSLETGSVDTGSATIFATSARFACTAMVIDASASLPHGMPLHLRRHNALAGTQE